MTKMNKLRKIAHKALKYSYNAGIENKCQFNKHQNKR